MPRHKKYIEEEVLEKAMLLFWENGISNTSMRMLEKQMGINQFSIYASFKDKKGLTLEAMKCYRKKITHELLEPLQQSNNGMEAIKKYCIDFISFSSFSGCPKGCFMTNTIDEYGSNIDELLKNEMTKYATELKQALAKKIIQANTSDVDQQTIAQYVNYILISLQGVSISSQFMEKQELIDFINIMVKKVY